VATPILVELSASAVQAALALADASFRRNANRRGGREHYANTLKSHKVGKIGEVACSLALTRHGIAVIENFRDPSREGDADVVAGGWRLEVKTWSDYAWERGGRCVTPGQLPEVRAKADCVVWCTTEGQLDAGRILVRGWSTMDDIARTEPRITTVGQYSILNHQVDDGDVRDLAALVAAIRNGAP